jgi:disulfide bond formation protein DsbB
MAMAQSEKRTTMMRMFPTSLFSSVLARWPAFALGISMAMLATAHGFERFGKMVPCALCLHQREAYWAAASIAVLALVAHHFSRERLTTQAFGLLLVCAFGAGAIIAGFHVGVEYKWWAGLATCAAGGSLEPSTDLLGALSNTMGAPACDQVAWSMFGLSMAGWNMVISAGLALMSLLSVLALHEKKEPAIV